MNANKTIILNSDGGIRVGGVTSWVDPTAPTEAGSATVIGRLYDKRKVRALTEDTDGDGPTPTLVTVSSAEPYLDNDPIELRLDNGTYHSTTIASRDEATNVLTLATPVPAGRIAAKDTLAKRKLGADIAMSLYGGTPAPESDAWGYIGNVSDTHEGIHLGAKVLCEVDIDNGAGQRRIVSFEAKVING